jgi:hypothetical protein
MATFKPYESIKVNPREDVQLWKAPYFESMADYMSTGNLQPNVNFSEKWQFDLFVSDPRRHLIGQTPNQEVRLLCIQTDYAVQRTNCALSQSLYSETLVSYLSTVSFCERRLPIPGDSEPCPGAV